jgi:hypothetical protein
VIPRPEFKIVAFPHGGTHANIIPVIGEDTESSGKLILSITAQTQALSSPAKGHTFTVSERFTGRIFLVEGQRIAGCTPSSMHVFVADEIGTLTLSRGRFFPPRRGENEIRSFRTSYSDDPESLVSMPIYRYIVGLERGTEAVFLRLKQKSGQPILQHISVPHDEFREITM